MNNHAIYFYLLTDDSCILFYRVRYCISYRTENKLFYFIYFLFILKLEIKVVFFPMCRLSCWRPTLWTRRTSWLTGRPFYPGVGCAATAPHSSSRTASASAITSRKSARQLDSHLDLNHFARSGSPLCGRWSGSGCDLRAILLTSWTEETALTYTSVQANKKDIFIQ